MRRGIVVLAVFICANIGAQRVVSARAGMIHYLQGRVTLDGKRIGSNPIRFRQMENGQTLATSQRARAEILLNPTTYLRVGESSSIKLLSDDLLDTRVALLTGAAVVDVRELDHGNRVTLEAGEATVGLLRSGVYQFTTVSGGRVRVYDGEALVDSVKVTKGWEMLLNKPPAEAAKFDRKEMDSLYLWSEQRTKLLEPRVGFIPWRP